MLYSPAWSSPGNSSIPPRPAPSPSPPVKPDGAYYLFATRYRERLAGLGITLDIRESAGSVENIDLLQSPDAPVDLAFVQGGTGDRSSAAALKSLGSLYFEPLWVFYRGPKTDRLTDRLTDLADMRTAIGEPGSGTRRITLTLLADNFIDAGADTILPLGGQAAADALLDGSIDAAFFVASPEAPVVQRLLHRPDIRLLSFARAAAYVQTHHYLSAVTLPEGIIDLQANIPARDTTLLAPTANLVARADFHPALISLLLQIVSDVHRDGSLFSQPGDFPNAHHLEYPLDKTAARFYRHGPPLLQRYLPFWTADLVDRMKVMLVPLLTLLIPLVKIMPPVYRWQVRKKIYRWYRLLRELDIDDSGATGREAPRRTAAATAVDRGRGAQGDGAAVLLGRTLQPAPAHRHGAQETAGGSQALIPAYTVVTRT